MQITDTRWFRVFTRLAYFFCIIYSIIFTVALIFGSPMAPIPLWIWILPVVLFVNLFLDLKKRLISGSLFVIIGIFLTIWDSITGTIGFPYFHLTIVVGGIMFIVLWRVGDKSSTPTEEI